MYNPFIFIIVNILLKELLEMASPVADISDDQSISILKKLKDEIKKQYPNVGLEIGTGEDDNAAYEIDNKLFVDTEETQFSIRILPKSKGTLFSVDALWPDDEKGKKKLGFHQMVSAIKTIPGMK